MSNYSILFLSAAMCIGLSSCGGGGGSGGSASFDAQNAGFPCDERAFLNDTVGAPAIYYNAQIPVSNQVNQGSFTTDNVYVHDFEARTITITQTTSVGSGRETTVYSLDDAGRPTKKTRQVVNFAIQLNEILTETRYNYDSDGLVTSLTLHSIVDDQPVEQPFNTVTFTWTDIAGIETRTSPAIGNSSGRTYTYQYDCTTLLSVVEEFFETSSSPAVVRSSTIVTSGSGRAVTTVTTPGRQLVFDSFGNLMQAGDQTLNYEPTGEQVVNIILFENALGYRGLI